MPSNQQGATPADNTPNEGGLDLPVDPGATDLGDDVYRDVDNRGGVLDDAPAPALEGGLDPGNTDLGDDVFRDVDNTGGRVDGSQPGLEGGLDPGNTDLGDDVYRDADLQ